MLACCPLCDKLCPARQGPQKWGSRERTYYVEAHDEPMHEQCGTRVRFVLAPDDQSGAYYCERGHKVAEDNIVSGAPCTGHRREIR